LIGAASMEDAIGHAAADVFSARSAATGSLDVVTSGSGVPPNPAELLESRAMKLVLDRARSEYDLVVIDTPPMAAVSDAFPLLARVDGVVLVGWIGRNRRDVARRLSDTFTRLHAPLLGVIGNGFKAGRNTGYGYAYAMSAQEETTPARPPSSERLEPSVVEHNARPRQLPPDRSSGPSAPVSWWRRRT
jgi:Mrp family chromosome partitioning ATPase